MITSSCTIICFNSSGIIYQVIMKQSHVHSALQKMRKPLSLNLERAAHIFWWWYVHLLQIWGVKFSCDESSFSHLIQSCYKGQCSKNITSNWTRPDDDCYILPHDLLDLLKPTQSCIRLVSLYNYPFRPYKNILAGYANFCWLVRGSLFIELGFSEDLGKGWRGDLGTFMISRPI